MTITLEWSVDQKDKEQAIKALIRFVNDPQNEYGNKLLMLYEFEEIKNTIVIQNEIHN